MSAAQLDAAARILASGLPRRQVFSLLARTLAGGAVVAVTSSEARAQPGCRREGHPCEGNQTCCPGLTCAKSGQGSARRCTAGGTTECKGDCPTAQPDVIVVGTDIDIEADCAYSGEMQRSTCTFSAAGTGNVESLIVPRDILCAGVDGGDFEEVDFDVNAQPSGTGLKSTRQEEGAAVVTIELDGEVTTAATATYWCETDLGELVPVTGPGLRCEGNPAPTAVDVSNNSGAVVVYAQSCDVASANADVAWFDVCQVPTSRQYSSSRDWMAKFRSTLEPSQLTPAGSAASDSCHQVSIDWSRPTVTGATPNPTASTSRGTWSWALLRWRRYGSFTAPRRSSDPG